MKKKSRVVKNFRNRTSIKGHKDDSNKIDRVRSLVASLCADECVELVHLEDLCESDGRVLRVYIDKPGGVTIDDCSSVSRELGDVLDVEWDVSDSYRLEVSSPGLERPLGQLDDFIRFDGEKVKVKLVSAFNGKKNFSGKLAGVYENMIKLCVEGKIITLEYDNIAQARLMVLNGDS